MIKNAILTVVAVAIGYAVMVLLITLVQESWFGGISWDTTPFGTLVVAGFFTMLAAFVGAAVATAVVHRNPFLPAIIMSLLVSIETTALVLTGKVGGPLWFDVSSALLLISAIIAGAWFWNRYGKSNSSAGVA